MEKDMVYFTLLLGHTQAANLTPRLTQECFGVFGNA
jgi:hypothetical protein